MRKTIKILRMEDAKEDYSWALAFSDEEKVNLATRLLHDLWQASQPQPFPRMDRQKVVYTQGGFRSDILTGTDTNWGIRL